MVVREIEDADFLAHLGQSSGPRSEGLHLSTIIKLLMRRLQPSRFDTGAPMDMTRVEIGLIFENMLEQGLAEKFGTMRPGEVFSDEGVAMSPDGVNPTEAAVEEFKATYMSSRGGICEDVIIDNVTISVVRDKYTHWDKQIKGYCKWLGVKRAILRVLYLCGDYSKPIQPQFKSYAMAFTEEELDRNWDELMQVAREEGLL